MFLRELAESGWAYHIRHPVPVQSPPNIGHLLLDFFGLFITQGQSAFNGFHAEYLRTIELVEQIRTEGLYPGNDSSGVRRRIYLQEPDLQFNATGKLLLVVTVDDDRHRLVHCLARQTSLCGQKATVTASINSGY